MRYVHTNIISKDWKKLADFYIEVFECKIKPPIRNQSGEWLSKGTGVENAALQGVHLILPGYGSEGPTLEIYNYENMEDTPYLSAKKRGFGHIAFEVDNVHETFDKMVKYGGIKCGEIISRDIEGVGTITFTYARDPEGNLIELQSWQKD